MEGKEKPNEQEPTTTTTQEPDNFKKLQEQYDNMSSELSKLREIANNQKIRAEKAEQRLKELKPATQEGLDADKTVVSELTQKLEIEANKRKELEQRLSTTMEAKKEADIAVSLLKFPNIKPDLLPLLKTGLEAQTDVVDGKTVVITPGGAPRISAKTNETMTVEELIETLVNEHKSLIGTKVDGGTGDKGNVNTNKAFITLDKYEKMSVRERALYRNSLPVNERAKFMDMLASKVN